ncbi:MAG: DUF5915 domain-containing protein, partial [Candidatus Pacebacteria bacterium]|nr:DUF5915 domain-containing protein [Candidatus Paceibacterota bacterium]
QEKQATEQTLHSVLSTLATLIAPLMPFLAETMYQELKREGDPESVHLCDWPKANKKVIADELENQMTATRAIVSSALAKRAELGVGVRQPITALKIRTKNQAELLRLIQDEVNAKEILIDESMKDGVELDITMTDELKEEGQLREVIRHIQDLRKKAGLKPADKIDIHYSAADEVNQILSKNQKQILETTKSRKLLENDSQQGEFLASKEIKIDNSNLWLGIIRV